MGFSSTLLVGPLRWSVCIAVLETTLVKYVKFILLDALKPSGQLAPSSSQKLASQVNPCYSSGSHTFKGAASRLSAVPTRFLRNMSIPQEVASLPGKYEYSAGRARCTAASSYAYSMPQRWKNLTKFATQPTLAVPEL